MEILQCPVKETQKDSTPSKLGSMQIKIYPPKTQTHPATTK